MYDFRTKKSVKHSLAVCVCDELNYNFDNRMAFKLLLKQFGFNSPELTIHNCLYLL